jgi:hypothetical protein
LAGSEEQQKSRWPGWEFTFPNPQVRVFLSDAIKVINDKNLHTGLNIIVGLEENSERAAKELSMNFSEMLLNFISFSSLAHCSPVQLRSIIKLEDKEPHPARYYSYPFAEKEIMTSLSVLDENVFGKVFESYDPSPEHQKRRVMRALSWLRKGLGEENALDEFVSYWVGLEVVKPLLRRYLQWKVRNPGEWSGVEDVFAKKLGLRNFKAIKENGRNGLLHGHRELDDSFVGEIRSYIEPIRKTLIVCIGNVLGLDDSISLGIANKAPRRAVQDFRTIIDGSLSNIPMEWKELAGNYPMVESSVGEWKVLTDEEGKLSVKFAFKYQYHGPVNSRFNASATELWGSKNLA